LYFMNNISKKKLFEGFTNYSSTDSPIVRVYNPH